ncbi:MAG: thioredoxin family protein [Castellaniella sp.]
MAGISVEQLDTDSFSTALARERGLLIVYFHAPWCRPCKTMKPVFMKLADELFIHDANFAEVNIAVSPTIAQMYGIRSVPSIAIFRGHMLAAIIAGDMPFDQLVQRMKHELSL